MNQMVVDYDPMEIATNGNPLSNSDFPYAEQDEALADDYAKAWEPVPSHLTFWWND